MPLRWCPRRGHGDAGARRRHRPRGVHAAAQPQLRLRRRCLRVPRWRRRPRRQRTGSRGASARAAPTPTRRTSSASSRAASRSGSPRCVSASRKRACLLADRRPTIASCRWPIQTPPHGSRPGATRSIMPRPALSRYAAAEGPPAHDRRHLLLRPLDHAGRSRRAGTTRGSSWRPRRPSNGRCTTTARPSRPSGSIRRRRCDASKAHELDLIFPTISNLEAISRFDTAADLLAAAAVIDDVVTVLPKGRERRRPACASSCRATPATTRSSTDACRRATVAADRSRSAKSRMSVAPTPDAPVVAGQGHATDARWCGA